MAEEVAQDLARTALCGAEVVLDVRPDGGRVHELGDFGDGVADREEDAVDLGVFVYCGG